MRGVEQLAKRAWKPDEAHPLNSPERAASFALHRVFSLTDLEASALLRRESDSGRTCISVRARRSAPLPSVIAIDCCSQSGGMLAVGLRGAGDHASSS